MFMQLVPFNPMWAESGSKLDLGGIYQRGDVLCALPIRRHNDWTRKGFRYVTLATRGDAALVRGELAAAGVNMEALSQSYERTAVGAFLSQSYAADQPARDAQEQKDLEARLAQLADKGKKGRA
jgi:hypothetical protein